MRTESTRDSIVAERRAYHVNEFCQRYGIGRTGFYKLLKGGKLPSVVIAGRRIIPHDAAEALLKGEDLGWNLEIPAFSRSQETEQYAKESRGRSLGGPQRSMGSNTPVLLTK